MCALDGVSNFYIFVTFNQRSMKLGIHVLYEALNQTMSTLLAQPEREREEKRERDFLRHESKKDDKLGHDAWAQCFGATLGREA